MYLLFDDIIFTDTQCGSICSYQIRYFGALEDMDIWIISSHDKLLIHFVFFVQIHYVDLVVAMAVNFQRMNKHGWCFWTGENTFSKHTSRSSIFCIVCISAVLHKNTKANNNYVKLSNFSVVEVMANQIWACIITYHCHVITYSRSSKKCSCKRKCKL